MHNFIYDGLKTTGQVLISIVADGLMRMSKNKGGEHVLILRKFDNDESNIAYGKVIVRVVPITKEEYDNGLFEAPILYNEKQEEINNG